MKIVKWLVILSLLIHAAADVAGAEILPAFPLTNGWLGGDVGYSVPMAEGRALWMFGDTFVRTDDMMSRKGSAMVGNSIAISDTRNGQWNIRYFWRKDSSGKQDAFFTPGTNAFRYWPLDGFLHDGKLYVCLIQVRPKGDGPLGFDTFGVHLAEVSNLNDENPMSWSVRYHELTKGDVLFPGISAVVKDPFVYLFSSVDDSAHKLNRPVILFRIPLAKLAAPAANLQYKAKNGQWKRGLVWEDAEVLMDKGATEMTVRYHPGLRKWIAVQPDNGFPSKSIVMRTAPEMEGPWSDQRTIYQITEADRRSAIYRKDHFFYAGKAHIEYASVSESSLVLTYAGNTFNGGEIWNNLEIYRLKTVVVNLK